MVILHNQIELYQFLVINLKVNSPVGRSAQTTITLINDEEDE